MFNIRSFVMPDDLEFLAMVESLDTPQKISDYMKENFEYELHRLWTPTPYILWKYGKGDCNDFATFGTFIANYHGYETWQIAIWYSDSMYSHIVSVYQEGRLSYMDNRTYVYGFDTFLEIVWDDDKMNKYNWEAYKVYDYESNIIERGMR